MKIITQCSGEITNINSKIKKPGSYMNSVFAKSMLENLKKKGIKKFMSRKVNCKCMFFFFFKLRRG